MRQMYRVALLLVLVGMGMDVLVTSTQVAASENPSALNQTKITGQLLQGSGTTNVRDKVPFQDHVSVILCHISDSDSVLHRVCEETP